MSFQSCAEPIARIQHNRQQQLQQQPRYRETEHLGSYRQEYLGPGPWKRYRRLLVPSDVTIVERDLANCPVYENKVLYENKGSIPESRRRGWFPPAKATEWTTRVEQARLVVQANKWLTQESDATAAKKLPRPPRESELAFDLPTRKHPITEKSWHHVPLPHFHDECDEDGEINLEDVAVECARGDENERVRHERLAKLVTRELRQVTDQRKANAIRRKLVSLGVCVDK